MTIENALEMNRIDLESEIDQARTRDDVMTPVKILGKMIIDRGHGGLKNLSSRVDDVARIETKMSAADEEYNMRRLGLRDASIVVLGASIISIENAIKDQQYDHEEFLAIANTGRVGTLYPEFVDENQANRAQPVRQEIWMSMVRIAREDKFFTNFFKRENQHVIPDLLRGFLERNGYLAEIRRMLFPTL
jgi:hypothetical protein